MLKSEVSMFHNYEVLDLEGIEEMGMIDNDYISRLLRDLEENKLNY